MSKKGKLVKPENTLKKKVGNGGFNEVDLVKAQAGIDSNQIDFRPLASDLLKELDDVLAKIKAGEMADNEKLGHIMYPLMQLKSQGGLFQYPIVSRISHSTLDFLENIDGVDGDVLSIVIAYRKTMQAIIAMQMKGADTPAGNMLQIELENAFARYNKSKQK